MNTANIGKPRKTAVPQSGKNKATPEKVPDIQKVTVKDSHPHFGGQSVTIIQFPKPDAAIVELNTGERHLIYLQDLNMEESSGLNKLQLAHHLKLIEGGLVEIHVPNNPKINARLGRIATVGDRTVSVWVRDVEQMLMQLDTLKHVQVEPLLLETEPQLKQVCDRINKLRKYNLDAFEVEIALYWG